MGAIRRFSKITPLTAAIEEAAADRELQRIIQLRFQKFGECPTSDLFPTTDAVESFHEHSFGVVGRPKPRPMPSLGQSCDWRTRSGR